MRHTTTHRLIARLLTAVIVGAGTCVAQRATASAPATRAVRGPALTASRVEVTCDFDAPLMVEQVGEVLTAAIPVYEGALGVTFPKTARLVIHLFGTGAAYAAAVARVAGKAPVASTGCTAYQSRASYLIVAADAQSEFVRIGRLPASVASSVRHEAAHQFAMKAGSFPLEGAPDWYCEGQACWLEAKAKAATAPPESRPDLARWDAQRVADAFAAHRLPPVDVLIAAETAVGAEPEYPQYAAWCSLYSFLADERSGCWHRSFVEFEDDLRQQGWPDAVGRWSAVRARAQVFFRARFPDLPALDRAWSKRPRPREWAALELDIGIVCGEITCAGTATTTSRALRPDPSPADAFTLSGEFSIDPGEAAEVVVTVAHDEEAGTWLDLVVDARGGLKLCGRGDGWSTTFATARCSPLTQGGDRWHRFEVGVHSTRITATVDAWPVDAAVVPRWLKGTARPGVGAKGARVVFRHLVLSA